LTITTRVPEELEGVSVYTEGGEVKSIETAGCAPGTIVNVKDLFYNTPARRKFLKGNKAENVRVMELAERLAVSQPGVRFKLKGEGRGKIRTPGSGDLLETIAAVHGMNLARGLIKVEGASDRIILSGYVSRPETNRGTRKYQDLYVNRRYIKNTSILQAVEEAYRGFLPRGRYPLAFLFLQIPVSEVDVNVHPGKLEVRLHREREIKSFVYSMVKQRLHGETVIPRLQVPFQVSFNNKNKNENKIENNNAENILGDRSIHRYRENFLSSEVETPEKTPENVVKEAVDEPVEGTVFKEAIITNGNVFKEKEFEYQDKFKNAQVSQLKAIGQVCKLYIIALGTDGIYILDQHAAHERIIYEKLLKTMEQNVVKSQILAMPVVLEMSGRRAELLIKHLAFLREMGFILEEFGDATFRLCGVPEGLEPGEEEELFNDIMDLLEARKTSLKNLSMRESLLTAMACKKAVKSGEKLSDAAMAVILDELAACENPFTCPHGRPTMIRLSLEELAKKFKR